ncbi:6555_t:CDS:2, partial [Cetraspora pellucida]
MSCFARQSHSSILDLMGILRCIGIVPLTWTSFDRCLERKSHAPARTCLVHEIDNFFSEIHYVIAIRDSNDRQIDLLINFNLSMLPVSRFTKLINIEMFYELNLKSLSFESLEPALIFYHRIELKLWTGEEEKEVKIFYDAIEYALKDELLEKQRKEKLLLLKEIPPEIIKSVVSTVNSLHANKMLVTSHKKEKIQDITTNILNLKRSNRILRGKCSDEEYDAYQDIYNTLDELVLKSDDNDYDSLNMEVIDITSKWASKFKDTTVNFAKGVFSKKLELEEDLVEECKKVIQESQNNTNLKWIISESSIASLGHWVETLESRKKCSQNNIWKLSMDWNKKQSERNFLTQVIEPLLSVALDDLPVDVTYLLKGELQSRANQDYKSVNTKTSAIGDRPDIMFTVKISEKALELLYVESGRCKTTEKKVSSDHTKLICLCKSGYNFVTTQKRLKDNKDICSFLTILGINITGKHMKIYGLQRKNNIYFYFPIVEADIPVKQTAWENVHEL